MIKTYKIIFVLLLSIVYSYGQVEQEYSIYNEKLYFEKGSSIHKASVIQKTLTIPDANWIRLYFDDVKLSEYASITITSLKDGGTQVLDSKRMEEWGNSSAYFNGNTLSVTITNPEKRTDVGLTISGYDKGLKNKSSITDKDGFCSGNDRRVASNDAAVGRIFYLKGVCSSWIVSNGKMITAGHCVRSMRDNRATVEFNVPPSAPDGTFLHSPPEDQYIVNLNTIKEGGKWVPFMGGELYEGLDWAVFEVYPNNETRLTPLQAQRKYFELEQSTPGNRIRITGYGLDDEPTKNGTQQTHTNQLSGLTDLSFNHNVDSTSGNSGSVIIDAATGKAIGIHSASICVGGDNSQKIGIRVTSPDFLAAVYGNGGGQDPCDGVPQYVWGMIYNDGDKVVFDNVLYELQNNEWVKIGDCQASVNLSPFIEQKDIKKRPTIFPNPTTDKLNFSVDQKPVSYQLYSVSGVLIKEGVINNKEIDVQSLNKGMYILKFVDDKGISNTTTFIKS
ncbi:T9SS type A sorting domain-containing protein [Aquimarina aquimarini]|uniref:T9SS type A sorting domain-containing protein n=1 Tax=Aquimarina aquimarini TaxID=1191734 RepID=UPI000D55FF62|nr:T9SS type A sorting domain-containing protein [Aquimarina aquimarini]